MVCNYRPQQYLRKGNVFTSVCQEFYPGGGRAWQKGEQAWRRGACVVKGACTAKGGMCGGGEGACMAGGACVVGGGMCGRGCMAGETATAADGTHPTGMHSCLRSASVY